MDDEIAGKIRVLGLDFGRGDRSVSTIVTSLGSAFVIAVHELRSPLEHVQRDIDDIIAKLKESEKNVFYRPVYPTLRPLRRWDGHFQSGSHLGAFPRGRYPQAAPDRPGAPDPVPLLSQRESPTPFRSNAREPGRSPRPWRKRHRR